MIDDAPWRRSDFDPHAAANAAYPEGITRYEVVPPCDMDSPRASSPLDHKPASDIEARLMRAVVSARRFFCQPRVA